MENWTQARIDAYFDIVRALNKQEVAAGGLFDCGDLGFCLIEWRRYKWEGRWFEARQLSEISKETSHGSEV